jgi:hypothetical protein
MRALAGTGASSGIAVGPARRLAGPIYVRERRIAAEGMPSQQRRRPDQFLAPPAPRCCSQGEAAKAARGRKAGAGRSGGAAFSARSSLRERVRSSTRPPIAPACSPAGVPARHAIAAATLISRLSREPSTLSMPR